ncbi:MAG: hypothetical protein LPK85_07060 [Gammaproteobacteria bacterium]|nr:hypothetical protein [Gammaproteobacteria bacterium]
MSSTTDLLQSIRASENGLTLAELLTGHPDIARRTAQRQIAKLIESGQVTARGEGRARRYFGAGAQIVTDTLAGRADSFPHFIPLSADSQDILSYIDQPPEARKPVGYQRDFLDAYRPNVTWYLSEPLRLAWRDLIKQTIREVITQPGLDPLSSIQQSVAERVPEQEQPAVQALIIEELRRLHKGVLARYGLRPSEYAAWKARQGH